MELFELKIPGLEQRFFGSTMYIDKTQLIHRNFSADSREVDCSHLTEQATGMKYFHMFPSANYCQWIINFEDLALGTQVIITK